MKPIKVWIARDKNKDAETWIYHFEPQSENDVFRAGVEGDLPCKSSFEFGLEPGQCQQFEIRKVKEKRK